MENHETLMKDSAADGAVKGNIITTVTPERKAEEEKAEQEDAQMGAAETPEPAVSTPLRQDTKVKSFKRLELFLFGNTYNIPLDCQRSRGCFLEAAATMSFEALFEILVLFSLLMSVAEENLPVAFSLIHCSRLGINASHLLCALLISFSFLVLPLTPHFTCVCVCVLMRIRTVSLRSYLLTHAISFR